MLRINGVLLVLFYAPAAFSQPAPQRSDELCASLKESSATSGKEFKAYKPGACMMNIDTGYNLFVDYTPDTLMVSLSANPVLLNGDAGAFWLRLSAFDNLAHTALETPQRVVFDEVNKLAIKLSKQELQGICGTPSPCDASTAKGSLRTLMLFSKADRATVSAREDGKSAVFLYMASATVNNIEKMSSRSDLPPNGRPAAWRSILALSLQAFAEGAQSYARNAQARQPIYRTSQSCWTNFVGRFAFTNCN